MKLSETTLELVKEGWQRLDGYDIAELEGGFKPPEGKDQLIRTAVVALDAAAVTSDWSLVGDAICYLLIADGRTDV